MPARIYHLKGTTAHKVSEHGRGWILLILEHRLKIHRFMWRLMTLDDSSVGFLPFLHPLPALLRTRRLTFRAGGLPFPRAGRHGVCDRVQKPRDRLLSSFLAARRRSTRGSGRTCLVKSRLAILLTTFLATRRGRARGGIPLVFPGRGTSQLEPGHGRPPLSMGHVGTQHLPRRRRGNAFEKCTEIRTTEKIQRMF